MTERDERSETADISEFTVRRDRAETFRLGVRLPLTGGDEWAGSLFCSRFLLLRANWTDLGSVGVPNLELPGRGIVMNPYRSTSAPSRSSQSSRPPASSVSRFWLLRMSDEELPDLGVAQPGANRAATLKGGKNRATC